MTSYGTVDEQSPLTKPEESRPADSTSQSAPQNFDEAKEAMKDGWRRYLCELIGTMLFVYSLTLRGGSTSLLLSSETATTIGAGLSLGAAILIFGPVSGGHFNPAVSFACFIAKRISALDLVIYTIVQIVGSFLGALLVQASIDTSGGFTVPVGVSWFQGILIELILTATLVTVYLSVTTHNKDVVLLALAMGGTLTAMSLASGNTTGASLNPARSLGPAIVGAIFGTNEVIWRQHYIYWVGPLLGACASAVTFKCILDPADRWIQH